VEVFPSHCPDHWGVIGAATHTMLGGAPWTEASEAIGLGAEKLMTGINHKPAPPAIYAITEYRQPEAYQSVCSTGACRSLVPSSQVM
jgi:hypothetical protein